MISSDFNLGIWSVIFSLSIYVLFRKRTFGLFDPLTLFLIMRMGPMLAVLLYMLIYIQLTDFALLFLMSSTLFVIALYWSTPKINFIKTDCGVVARKFIFHVALFIFVAKIAIIISVTGSMPIFSEGGSDAYIQFDLDNKVGSALLLGLGVSDLLLFAFLLPMMKSRLDKFLIFPLFIASMLVGMSGGKKSSLLVVFAAIALSEYLRLVFVSNQHGYFLTRMKIVFAIMAAILWATWTYAETTGASLEMPDWDIFFIAIDFVASQYTYPFLLFVTGELADFFRQYKVNNLTYFFHSILSPLGYPVFTASIGPSLGEFQSGLLTGHGTNPMFIIEGYVLFGWGLPIYSFCVGLVIGKMRGYMLKIKKLHYKIVLSALILPAINALAIDGLLFAKMMIVIAAVFIVIKYIVENLLGFYVQKT